MRLIKTKWYLKDVKKKIIDKHLYNERGHCKSDYNMAKNKVIIDSDKKWEEKADLFALDVMIPNKIWKSIMANFYEANLLKISKNKKISMCFLVTRLAKENYIKYNSSLYNKYIEKIDK